MKKIVSLLLIMLMIIGMTPGSFAIASPADNATITITTDDAYELYVNGTLEGSGNSWAVVDTHRVYLAGEYTIAIKGMDKAFVIAGLTVTITFDDNDTPVTTNSGWVYSTTEVSGWNQPGFDDSAWSSVSPVTPHQNWPKGYSWIWSPNYLATNEVFDRTVYFRYDGFKDLPDVINISPIFEGYVDNGGGNYTAFFGFENKSHDGFGNPIDVTLPIGGPDNFITGDVGGTVFPSNFNYPNVVSGRPGRTPFFPNALVRVDDWDGETIVWTLNGRTATAGLSGKEHKPTIEVKPIFEGWVDNGDGTYKAYFGYLNNSKDAYGNPMEVTIPFNTNDNKVTGYTGTATFPSVFSIGRTPGFPNTAIVIDGWNGSNIVWKIFTRTATAGLSEAQEKELPTEGPSNEPPEQTSEETTDEPAPPTPPTTEPAGPQANVTVNFVDGNNNAISPSFVFSGTIGSNYITTPRTVEGFTLVESPANASGSFVEGGVVITYVYTDGTDLVDVEDEEVALGAPAIDLDSIYDDEEAETEAAEEEEEIILDEVTPLADALPQTGQASPELFFGIGSLITAAGITLKKRNK